MEDAHRHPFADDDEIQLAVMVVVDPGRRRDHPSFGQLRREVERDIGKATAAVVPQQVTLWNQSIATRHDSAADEDIRTAVAVEVADRDTGAILEDVRNGVARALEVPVTVIQIKTRSKCVFPAPELVSAADHEQVRKTVAVGVEKRGADVFVQTVGSDRGLIGSAEGAVLLLNEEFSGLPLRSANIEIVEAVAVHIPYRQSWTFGGDDVRQQWLAIVIVEAVLLVVEADTAAIRDVGKKR